MDIKTPSALPAGYSLTSLTVNGKSFTSGTTYTVKDRDVVIKAKFEKNIEKRTVTFPDNVTVTRTEVKLHSGDVVKPGDVLWITAVIPDGYSLKSLTVNGQTFSNGLAYLVSDKNVDIAVEFSENMIEVVPISIRIASLPYKTTYMQNEQLKLDGCYIDITFSDGSVDNIPVTNAMVSSFDDSTIGTQQVIVVCEGLTAAFEVKVESGDISNECVTVDGKVKGWKAISEIIPENKDGVIKVLLNQNLMVPDYIVRTLDEYNVSMTAILNEKIAWILNSESMDAPYSSLDLGLYQFVSVPSSLIKVLSQNPCKPQTCIKRNL